MVRGTVVCAHRHDLDEAIERLDMQAWMDREGIEYRVTRGSRGIQLNVRECPVCGGKTFKVYMNAESGLGNCFHGDCETKFSKWKFIKASLGGLSNAEVVRHIQEVAKEQGWRPVVRPTMAVNMSTELKIPDSYELPVGGRNLAYLDNRNISGDLARYFKLRYCQKGSFDYTHEGKLVRQRYDARVIIPVFDIMGDLVSFQGRDITGKAEKKYLFPPGFASTGEHLYNGHNAWGAKHVVIGEGAFDVMAQKIALDEDPATRHIAPVGTFGKHLSDAQLDKLVQLKAEGLRLVTIMWDGERKAFEDAITACLKIHSVGITANIALLPADKDPNEVPTHVVREALWSAKLVNPLTAIALRLSRQYVKISHE